MPAYFHPAVAGADWRILAAAGRTVHAVILNIQDGPGRAPEPELRAVAAHIRAPMLGYVDTGYGSRPARSVLAEVNRYRRWYPTSGVFLDQVATGGHLLGWYADVVAAVRRHAAPYVVLNHGAHPDPGYAEIADALVTFEGPSSAHRRTVAPAWVRAWSPNRFWHLVYDTPPHRAADVLRHAAAQHAGVVQVTDRGGVNPWDGLPSYFTHRLEGRPCG